jgi:XTP/dITP diphosphohydrolase
VIVTAATANAGKVAELRALFESRFDLVPAADYQAPHETGADYLENARIKARALFARLRAAVLADDSGLEVDALGGRPGVHSARYGSSADERNHRLLAELRGRVGAERRARFRSAVVLITADGREIASEGRCEGAIADEPRGGGGFGYDPIFLVPELGRTFGELSGAEKNRLSARARAARALLRQLDDAPP